MPLGAVVTRANANAGCQIEACLQRWGVVSPRVLLALELLKHELGASDEDICQRLRTDVAVRYACGLREVQAARSKAHFVLPETLAQFRHRLDAELRDALVAIQAAAAMQEGPVRGFGCSAATHPEGTETINAFLAILSSRPWAVVTVLALGLRARW
jgi:hypothetical protein